MGISRRASVLAPIVTAALIATLAPLAEAAPARCFGRRATIVGTSGNDRLRGTPGRDVIVGRGGRDVIVARGGNDLVCSGRGRDSVRLGRGRDRAAGGGAGDEIAGGRGHDRIFLEGGSDEFGGGGPGNDVIDLGPGIFQFAVGSAGDDDIIGFTPEQGPTMDFVGYFNAPGPVTVDLAAGTAVGHGTDTLTSIDGVDGSEHNDILTGHGGGNFLFGGPGDDVINDGGNAGTFDAGPASILRQLNFDAMGGDAGGAPVGNDTFNAQGGGLHVVFYDQATDGVQVDLQDGTATGEGADTLNGVNAIAAGPGDDTLLGDGAQNGFDGGAGNDTIDGRGGEDTLIMFDAIDATADLSAASATGSYLTFTEQGQEDQPFVWSLAAMENIWGSTRGPDTLRGDDGPNELFGLAGADQLFGLGGPDMLNGGRGSDTGDGGAGSDDCISVENQTNCEGGPDASPRASARHAQWSAGLVALMQALR